MEDLAVPSVLIPALFWCSFNDCACKVFFCTGEKYYFQLFTYKLRGKQNSQCSAYTYEFRKIAPAPCVFQTLEAHALFDPAVLISRVPWHRFWQVLRTYLWFARAYLFTLSPNQNLWCIYFCLPKKSRNWKFLNYADWDFNVHRKLMLKWKSEFMTLKGEAVS